ncbi:MFS transporter [Nocardia sp. AG03]|uniref:MFS transporter n=1 Tax=Nocardia sp. AG03 TaxID=3025312 RepID=UPI002418306F|nr:MFS transporter [Nocardia sp. AG03]
MSRDRVDVRGLTVRAVLFRGTRDLLPIYALYGVLFADHGLSTAQISLLLAMWSVTAFVLEVPSGAWADTVSRRALLIASCLLQGICFALWMIAPSFVGFALGFVVWGIAGALESGTFEALIYDDLVARGAPNAYASIMGWSRGAQESTVLLAILAAAPLYALGGYTLVGWVSVGIALLHTATALLLPRPPVAISATAVDDLDDTPPTPDRLGPHAMPTSPPVIRVVTGTPSPTEADATPAGRDVTPVPGGDDVPASGGDDVPVPGAGGASVPAGGRVPNDDDASTPGDDTLRAPGHDTDHPAAATNDPGATVSSRYLTMLRTGLGEALRVRRVRRGVLLGALLYGVTAFDEYFGLLAVSGGASTSTSALLIAVTVVGSLLGSLLAGRTEAVSARTLAAALFVAGLLFIAGALAVGLGGTAMLWIGFVGIGIAYGIDFNAEVIAGARLQDSIAGPARATVTSVSGLLSEIVALGVFAFVALATQWLAMSTTIALLGLVILVSAVLTPTWLPPRPTH